MGFSLETVLWMVGAIALIVVAVVWLNLPYWKAKRELKRYREETREWEASLSDADRATIAKDRRRSRLAEQMNAGGMSAMIAIRELTESSDVAGLLSAFSLGNWQTRELVMAALGNVCRDSKAGISYDAGEMVAALKSIAALCNADSTGGSYRQNCLDHARMLLARSEFAGPFPQIISPE